MRLLVYSANNTPRTRYILSELLPVIGFADFDITSDAEMYRKFDGAQLNYSDTQLSDREIWIIPTSLLQQTSIEQQQASCFLFKGQPAFFATQGSAFPFDVFAASFYLLTRYEEYLPHTKDMYGRFAHENSIAFKEKFLQLPLINCWLIELRRVFELVYPSLQLTATVFKFIPTYDIDIAFSYREKGITRNAGGFIKSLLKFDINSIAERAKTLARLQQDPFDIYDWLDALHQQFKLQPVYFFLLAKNSKGYDKNIDPSSEAFQQLLRSEALKYDIGIHPSWQSGDDAGLLQDEINTLGNIIQKEITSSRQHYIRMELPYTYRQLTKAGITDDYSMGYGSINGFRASYALPYKWFDLQKNETTNLTVHPFCYMEANSIFEQKYTTEQALEELQHYYNSTREVNGELITIFHNHLITSQPSQIAWRKMYEAFLQKNL